MNLIRRANGVVEEMTPEEEATLVTPPERIALEAELAAQEELRLNLISDAIFDQLKQATAAEINTFVNNQFANLNATQRSVIKLLLQYVALQLRKE